VAIRDVARGRVSCREGSRHVAVPVRLFGDIVRAMA
jgi:hypothetical protein